jgi:hypothetical protein
LPCCSPAPQSFERRPRPSSKGALVEKQLFPDQSAYKKDENQRWELVVAHYDLPIKEIDPHSADE